MGRHAGGWDPSYENDMEDAHGERTPLTLKQSRVVAKFVFGLLGALVGGLVGSWVQSLVGEGQEGVSGLAKAEATLKAAALGAIAFAILALFAVGLYYRFKYRGEE